MSEQNNLTGFCLDIGTHPKVSKLSTFHFQKLQMSKAATRGALWKKLKKFRNIHRKTPMLESLLHKVTGLKSCNFIKKRSQHRCFSMNIAKFLRTPIFWRTSENGCFLNVLNLFSIHFVVDFKYGIEYIVYDVFFILMRKQLLQNLNLQNISNLQNLSYLLKRLHYFHGNNTRFKLIQKYVTSCYWSFVNNFRAGASLDIQSYS